MHGSSVYTYIHSSDTRPKITRKLLLRVLAYARPYWSHLAGMLLAILISTSLSLVSPLIFRHLIDTVLPSKNLGSLVGYAGALLTIPLLNGLIGVVQRRLNALVGEGVIYDLRISLFAKMQRMSLRFFTHTRIGELMSRLNNDVTGAQNAISNTIVNIITHLVQAAALAVVMFTLQWQLTLAGVLILPLFVLAVRFLATRLRMIARRTLEANAHMNAHMNETLNIGGALLVKLFGRIADEDDRFRQRAARVRDLGVQRAVYSSAFFAIVGLISAIGTALVYGLGGYYVIQNTFTVGTVVAFGSYLGQLYSALQGLANAPIDFSTSMVSFERVFEVVDLPMDIVEKKDAIELKDIRGDLEFDDVSFTYFTDEAGLLREVKRYRRGDAMRPVFSFAPEREREIEGERVPGPETQPDQDGEQAVGESQARDAALSGISFRAAPGQLVALVGPSGAGKTTTTYLIPRLYDPTSGSIRIDGHDLRDLKLDSLAAAIGMVTQENYLFHDTIRTNLVYAKPGASQEEIESAARAANIHDFVMGLPDRYETVVGERGYRLSGGEKQRIALARVILKDPRILVLDEATSHLDSESEALIQEALKRIMAGRTSIVIAHRLSTILAADLILVMDKGRIVEQGTHSELLAMGGLYNQLYETQFNRDRS